MKLQALITPERKKANKWTDEQLEKLKADYPVVKTPAKLAKALGRSLEAIKSKAEKLGLKRVRRSNDPWTPFRIDKLKLWYPEMENKVIAFKLGLRQTQVEAKGWKLGLKKTKEFMYMHSMQTSFKKGFVPTNKGKKQSEFMSADAIERTKATRFQKGALPSCTLYDGAITIRHGSMKNGKKPYKMIRIAKGKWQELQRYNWEKINGPIPKGMCLWCKTKDTLNCDPCNWEVITRAENVRRNSGSVKLKDGLVAFYILGKNHATPEAIEEIKKDKKLIEAKRLQLQLNRIINGKKSRKNKSVPPGDGGQDLHLCEGIAPCPGSKSG